MVEDEEGIFKKVSITAILLLAAPRPGSHFRPELSHRTGSGAPRFDTAVSRSREQSGV